MLVLHFEWTEKIFSAKVGFNSEERALQGGYMLEEKDLQAIAQLMDLKFQPLDSRLNNIEGHLEKIDNRLENVEVRLENVEVRLET